MKPTLRQDGPNLTYVEGGKSKTAVETTKPLPPEDGEGEPRVEHRVYRWRAANAKERDIHGWKKGHEIWGLESAHDNRDDALAAAVALAGE